ncbi:MAG TPA: dihydrolipoamide acetyltransferase family protein [Solirubrobacteraceae bacterium]|jgi:pyruvate dehydrogenase E2 component (dihydrolipoamide acetyltransferase)|nr:dihydrolipoamide acetyltransferase family protein [Solirubrobacteraceae bacterium]
MTEMVMPRLSDTMEEGTILRWLKGDGERVRRGEELVEIETDKANMTYESDQEGTLQIVAQEGDTLAVGQTIAHIGERGEAGALPPERDSSPEQVPSSELAPSSEQQASPSEQVKPARAALAQQERIKASPVARRVANENGVDLKTLNGSGPGGRIVRADVEAAGSADMPSAAERGNAAGSLTTTSAPIAPTASVAAVAAAKGETSVQELSRTQRTIARRMAESKATIPDFTLNMDVDMEACVALRTQLKELAQSAGPAHPAPTYNDMVVKASALALREFPRANGSYRDGSFELHARVNVGVAVATEDALIVPTVFDADTKSLGEIARETRTLAERVRAGAITPPELGGGTFTVSNLGMFGVTRFTAIINPPQAAILSVGALEPRPVVLAGGPDGAGEIVARHTMSIALACDHRILYGADAANFMARIRELLEAPASLTL